MTATESTAPASAGTPAPVRSLDIVAIQRAIPHRYPFLLVDKIDVIEEEKKCIGTKMVTINEPFFNGHFPGHPIMPGVLILEALAQAACAMMLGKPGNEGKIAYFMGIDGAKFRQPVKPGMVLKLHVEILRTGRMGKFRGEAHIEGVGLAAEAEMMFAVVDKEPKA
jgi:beta-hydroxyacyl-ACP dehydratase FabZ